MFQYRLIPRNTAVAEQRRVYFILRDATDLQTPEDISVTGVKAPLRTNGGSSVNSTNDIVKVNGATGEYYVELTQAEVDIAVGSAITSRVAPAGCAPSFLRVDIGQVALYSEPLTEPVGANVTQINGANVAGNGTSGNKWRAA